MGKPLAEIHPVPVTAAEEERLRAERDARDLEIINRNADQLNADALDMLGYQVIGSFDHRRRKRKKTRKR